MASLVYDPAPLAPSLRTLLAQFLSGDLKPQEFEENFAAATMAAYQTDDAEAQALCRAVEWEFLDRDRGLSTDSNLKARLQDLAKAPDSRVQFCVVSTYGEPMRFPTGSSTDVVPRDVRLGAPFGIAPSWEFWLR